MRAPSGQVKRGASVRVRNAWCRWSMPGRRTSPTGGVFAGSAIGSVPSRKMRFDQRQVVLIEPVRDLAGGGEPYAGMRQNIFHCATEGPHAMRLTDPVRMQGDAHDPALLGAFVVDGIKVVADLT